MKFFVMLAVLLLRNFYGRKLIAPLDATFAGWQAFIAKRLGKSLGSSAVFLLSVMPLVVLLWLLLWWLDGVYWYLPVLAIHLLTVIYALGRRCDLVWIERYLAAWQQKDYQAANYYAAEITAESFDAKNSKELHTRVISRLVMFAFDRLFFVLFWYLLLGPVGALMARLTEQAISNAQHQAHALDNKQPDMQLTVQPNEQPLVFQEGLVFQRVLIFQQVLEWPASRLMGLTLAITGKPLLGLRQFFVDIFRWKLSTEVFLNRQLLTGFGLLSGGKNTESAYCTRPEMMTAAADEELISFRERIWRSLVMWVAVTAIAVIFWF